MRKVTLSVMITKISVYILNDKKSSKKNSLASLHLKSGAAFEVSSIVFLILRRMEVSQGLNVHTRS